MIRNFIDKLLGKAPANATAPVRVPLGKRVELSAAEHGIDPELLDERAVKVVRTLQEAGHAAYIVGGAVRDLLVARRPKDFDVATDATPEQVKALFRRAFIIGRRFRIVHVVFGRGREHEVVEVSTFRAYLDADQAQQVGGNEKTSKSELAGKSHVVDAEGRVLRDNVWGPQIEDAARRDFTINAMYYDPLTRTVIDYHGGIKDIKKRALRMIGDPSARYREDPVRILRLARFAARWPGFQVAPETMALCRQMVDDGEADTLVPERVWQELARGLAEARPSRLFDVLRDCGALARVMPEVDRLWGVPQPAEHHPEVDTGVHLMMVLDSAARQNTPLAVRWACLVHDLGKGTTPPEQWPRHLAHEARSVKLAEALAERLRVPGDCRELGAVVAREHGNIHRCATLGAAATLRLLERCDALRRPERFELALWACECDARGRLGQTDAAYPQRPRLTAALRSVLAVDVSAVAARAMERGVSGPAIGEAVRSAREQALSEAL